MHKHESRSVRKPTFLAVAEHNSLTWICCNCGHPHSSALHQSMLLILSRGSLNSSINLTSSPQIRGDSPKCPLHTSTPEGKGKPPRTKDKTVKPLLKLLNINFQSSRNKIQELEHVVNSAGPDVIFLLSR